MQESNSELIRRWFEQVWNAKNAGAIEDLLDPEVVVHGLGEPIRGIDEFKRFHRTFLAGFSDTQVVVEDAFEEADRVCVRVTVRASHDGDGLGFKATGSPVEFTGMGICRVRDGKFVEVWNEFDFLRMYTQVGLIDLEIR